jgi:hypothetical protein
VQRIIELPPDFMRRIARMGWAGSNGQDVAQGAVELLVERG